MRLLAPAAAHLQMARALDLDRLLSTAYDWKRHGSLLADEPERLTTQNDNHFLARPSRALYEEAARSMKQQAEKA
ncbi:hypothetical protein BN1708_011061 [Verticillium longisporum]|uniref:Uncharacterized protein n=1 Tax=Verticillium longisporum TaxID=100787 RepID=A0A0G4KWF8_VERLO|nr:hypothetical protein BN1708_011061 [Verticillium longisporum]